MKPDPVTPRSWTRTQLVAGGVGAAAVLGLAAWGVREWGWSEACNRVVLGLRDAGPLPFFAAMAVLPAAGFPLLAFTLAAGPVFAPSLGALAVVLYSLVAIACNLLITYWLSQRALRPLAERLLRRFAVRLPAGIGAGAWELTLLVRLTPGPPFWAQSYLLGVLRVPLVPYLVVSSAVLAGFVTALVYGGQALVQGRGKMALTAAAVVGVLAAALQFLRKQLARRNAHLPS